MDEVLSGLFDSGGPMAEAIRRFDWSNSPLGPIEQWPDTLKMVLELALASHFPKAIVWGPELTTLYNDAFVPILGNKPAALGRPFNEIWEEAWDDLGPIVDAAYQGKATFIEDFPLLIRRGDAPERAYFTFCYSPVRDQHGRVLGMLDTVTETTLSVLANKRLAFLDTLGRAIASASDADAIMAITTQMVAEHLNLSNCAYADMDPDEDGFTIRGNWAAEGSPSIVGHYSLADFGTLAVRNLGAGEPLIINDNLAELEPHEAATFQAIGIAATICMPLVKDGRLTALMAIHDRQPHMWSSYELMLIREVTERSWAHIERVRAEAEMRRAVNALSELNATLEERVQERTAQLLEAEAALRQSQKLEAMGQLTGGVAHDFNNLLTPIVGTLDMLQRKSIGDERIQRLVAGGLQSAERARTLVQRLLAFARRQPLQPVPVDVGALIRDMSDLVTSTSGPRIKVVVDVQPDLPPALADRNQLEMAVLNLSVNARDAMPDGGQLSIEVCARQVGPDERPDVTPGGYVLLSVSDTGVGMDEQTLARAIEPFFSTKGVGKGTGLGLSMVHGLIAQLGGTLNIESKPGLGTSVTLWLPEADAGIAEARDDEEASQTASVGIVLMVDDEELVRASTADMLMELGYKVAEAGSGEEAIRQVDAGLKPQIVLTDQLMPGMTGAELAAALAARQVSAPVVIVSGFCEDDGLPGSLPRLTKPFKQKELAEALAQAMSARTER